MNCKHLTTRAEYKNKKLQGYRCIVCSEFINKPDYMKKRKDEKGTIKIMLYNGIIDGVEGLPDGWTYEIVEK